MKTEEAKSVEKVSFEDLIRMSILGRRHSTPRKGIKKSTNKLYKVEQKKEKKDKKARKTAAKSRKINRKK